MKKIITISLIAFLVLALQFSVLAQGYKQGQGGQGNRGIETATQNLNRVINRNNNPEIGEQVRSMIHNQEEIQTRTNTALHQMSQRNQVLRFMFGPDYRNVGQVRSDVVDLRNNIRKLEMLKSDILPEDATDVQGAIDELKVETDQLESKLTEELSGFSLFGWLAKLLTN